MASSGNSLSLNPAATGVDKMSDRIINLTPHVITLQLEGGGRVDLVPSGTVARIAEGTPGIPTTAWACPVPVWTPGGDGDVEGLPEPVWGLSYLVSRVVGDRVRRADLLVPGTGPEDEAVREHGQVVAVTRLKRVVHRWIQAQEIEVARPSEPVVYASEPTCFNTFQCLEGWGAKRGWRLTNVHRGHRWSDVRMTFEDSGRRRMLAASIHGRGCVYCQAESQTLGCDDDRLFYCYSCGSCDV